VGNHQIEREKMKPKTVKKGFISCAICGAKVQATLKTYGGIRRLVCSNHNCSESERKAFN